MKPRKDTQAARIALAGTLMVAARAGYVSWRARKAKGQVILVTGGNRGLGKEIARQYLALGARVIIIGRDEEQLENARQELSTLGEVTALPCDITDARQREELIATIDRQYGRLDGLVNNAGIVLGGPLNATTEADYAILMETNYDGVRHLTNAALPLLRRASKPWIVVIASAAGKLTVPYLIAYGTSKAAVGRYSEGLALELASEGIQVLTVYPSFIRSGVWDHAPIRNAKVPLRRIYKVITAIPLVSMSVQGAASRIVAAQALGKLKIVIPLSADITVRLTYLFPQVSARVTRLATRLLGEA